MYTPYDLTLKASQQRGAVRNALEEPVTDPFERINVDPFWEYKVHPHLDSADFRIGIYYRISSHQWAKYYLPIKPAAALKINED